MSSSSTARPVLVVAGDIVEDIVAWQSTPLAHGTDTPARIFRVRGGSAANVAVAAAAWLTVRFIGKVGADAVGEALAQSLRAAGVEAKLQRGGRSGTILVLVDPQGERTMVPDRGANTEWDSVDPAWLNGGAWLHVPLYGFEGGSTAPALAGLVEGAHRAGMPVSIDTSSLATLQRMGIEGAHHLLDSLAPTVLFANEDEAAYLGLHQRPVSAGRTVIVKNGPRPVQVFTPAQHHTIPVPTLAEVKDSTGAGDTFAAAFIAAQLGGASLQGAVTQACREACRVLTSPGALQ